MRLKHFLVFILAFLPCFMFAQRVENGVLTDCSGLSGEYHIEEGVVEIGEYAFMMSSVTKVYIPASVEIINKCAFSLVPQLTDVEFAPNSKLRIIGEQAFDMCDLLQSINIPNSVDSIGRSAFTFCGSLKKVTLPQSLRKLSYGTFSSCSSLTKISIPASCEEVGEFCFANCVGLGTAVVNAKKIGEKAFYNCKLLSNITLNEGVEEIADSAFARCVSIERLHLPKTLMTSGAKTFLHCPDFEGFSVAEGSPYMMAEDGILYSKDKSTLFECPQMYQSAFFEVPAETRNIKSMAFFECEKVEGIKIPNTIESIGEAALSYNGMKRFDFSGNDRYLVEGSAIYVKLKSASGYALLAVPCKGAETDFVLIPDARYIAKYVFANNQNVAKVWIPEDVLGLGDMAFYNCQNLQHIYSYAFEAPTLGEDVFGNTPFNRIELHVKNGAASSYQLANWPFIFGKDITEDYPDTPTSIENTTKAAQWATIKRVSQNQIALNASQTIRNVTLYNAAGNCIATYSNLNTSSVTLPYINSGIGIANIVLEDGSTKCIKF